MSKYIVATVIANGYKYKIESDTIVDIKHINGSTIERVRITGVSRMGDCIRGVANTSGVIEIPLKKIIDITESDKSTFDRITKTAIK